MGPDSHGSDGAPTCPPRCPEPASQGILPRGRLGTCCPTSTPATARCSRGTRASTGGSSPPCAPPASTAGRPARRSRRAPGNVAFHPSAAAAQRAGLRACKRCRPDASPGSPEWDVRGDLAGRALRLIADGVVDRDGVPGSGRPARATPSRQVTPRRWSPRSAPGRWRWPARSARRRRGSCWRRPTCPPPTSRSPPVSRACGSSTTPSGPSSPPPRPACAPRRRERSPARGDGRAAAGLPGADGPAGARSTSSPRAPCPASSRSTGTAVHPGAGAARRAGAGPLSGRDRGCGAVPAAADRRARPRRRRGAGAPAARPRRRPGRRRRRPRRGSGWRTWSPHAPGLRSPGAVDGFEMAVRAVVGQQISVRGAATVLGRIVAEHGGAGLRRRAVADVPERRTRLADADDLPLPRARAPDGARARPGASPTALTLDPGADRARRGRRCWHCPASGPWTADYVLMRALGDPDVLLGDRPGRAPRGATAGASTSPTSAALGAVALLRHPPPLAHRIADDGRITTVKYTHHRLTARRAARRPRRRRAHRPVPAHRPAPASGPTRPGSAPTTRSTTSARQLAEYFAGTRTAFDLPLHPAGTAFQQRVWAQLRDDPVRRDRQLRPDRGGDRRPAVGPGGRAGQRPEPDLDRRAVPPGDRRRTAR